MINGKKVVVVLPAYNASKTLKITYDEIDFNIVDDVILVDDLSNDDTVEVGKELGIKHIVVHEQNKGYGGNQKTCYNKALELGADIIIMLHPDYQYTPKLIPAMASLLGSGLYHVVLGSRILGRGALKGGMPMIKFIANRGLTFIQNILLGAKLSEYHTGYRAFSREILEKVNYNANSDNFVFDNQMLAQIWYAGYEIAEITCPTKYFDDASSINLKNSTVYALGVLKTSLQFRLQKWGLSKYKYLQVSDLKRYATRQLLIILFSIIGIISLSLISFVGYKAAITSMTHDESFTYLHYVHQSFMEIVSFKGAYTNNHILNSLLIKYSEKLLGTSELAIRLPNIVAFAVYLIYTFRIFFKQKKILWIPVFIFMTFNPFLLDFFGLARGYGLSIALMILSIFYLVNYFETKKNADLILFNAGAILSIFANFTMLNFYVAGLAVFNILLLSDFRYKTGIVNSLKDFLHLNKVNLISVFIALIILFEPVRKLAKHNVLDYGGKNGLVDTFVSQVYNAFYTYKISGSLRDTLAGVIVGILILNLLIIIVNFIRRDKVFFFGYKGMIVSNFVTIIILAATVVQHYLFNYDYLKDRFALFIYPLIILNISFLIYYLASFKLKYVIIPLAFLLIPLFSINMLNNLNISSYKDWRYDMDTEKMLEVLNIKREGASSVQLGINWLFEPTINFYKTTKNYEWLKPVNRNGLSEEDDFRYVMKNDMEANAKIIFSTEKGMGVLYEN